MATGHRHRGMGMGSHVLRKLLSDKQVQERLWAEHTLNRDYDIPYLGGYSEDGKTIYLDRHLPDEISFEVDGRKHTFRPDHYLCQHEKFEKAVMDTLGWSYTAAHEAATGYERRSVLASGIPWDGYQKSLKPYIKADERESLKKVPKNLDLRPYYTPPIDEDMIRRIKNAQKNKKD